MAKALSRLRQGLFMGGALGAAGVVRLVACYAGRMESRTVER